MFLSSSYVYKKAQRREVTCSESHSQFEVGWTRSKAQSDSEACALALLSDPFSLPPPSQSQKKIFFFFNGGERSLWKWRHFTYWVRFIIVHHS